MGMFTKDKEIGLQLTEEFVRNEEFLLLGLNVTENAVQTDFGWADRTALRVQRLGADGRRTGQPFIVATLGGAIASKAKEATPDEFPCIVKWTMVKGQGNSDATVIRWVRDEGNHAQPYDRVDGTPAPQDDGPPPPGDEDIPF